MEEYDIECSYEPCNCLVAQDIEGGEAYCSDACERAVDQGIESDMCSCGHPQCDEN